MKKTSAVTLCMLALSLPAMAEKLYAIGEINYNIPSAFKLNATVNGVSFDGKFEGDGSLGGALGLGYQINENFATEVKWNYVNFELTKFTFLGVTQNISGAYYQQNSLSIGGKYSPLTDNFRPYVGGSLGYSLISSDEKNAIANTSENSEGILSGSFQIGMDYKISELIAIGLGYSYNGNFSGLEYKGTANTKITMDPVTFHSIKFTGQINF